MPSVVMTPGSVSEERCASPLAEISRGAAAASVLAVSKALHTAHFMQP